MGGNSLEAKMKVRVSTFQQKMSNCKSTLLLVTDRDVDAMEACCKEETVEKCFISSKARKIPFRAFFESEFKISSNCSFCSTPGVTCRVPSSAHSVLGICYLLGAVRSFNRARHDIRL